jgi:NTE family protein
MKLNNKLIGLALSGGGIRATVFHLGVLKYLAQEKLFDRIVSISSVSGASLCIGAIFAANNNKWCSGDEFLSRVLPRVREIILTRDIEKSSLRRLPVAPAYWRNRVEIIADTLEKKWGVCGTLQDLPKFPYWEINCTTYETGRSFRIRRDYMGDYILGYTQNPNLRISRMMAASAGFPVLIGPYTLCTKAMRWTKDKYGKGEEVTLDPRITLWDGGVYDNLGLEALYKIGEGLDSEIDFLIASDASPPIHYQKRKGSMSFANMKRLLDIAMFQVGALRRREFMARMVSKGDGLYVEIGDCDYPTTLLAPSEKNFDMLLKRGFAAMKSAIL